MADKGRSDRRAHQAENLVSLDQDILSQRTGNTDIPLSALHRFLPNFLLISIISFTPYFWFYLVQVSFADIFQTVWGNSAILTAAKFIPIGLTALISVMIAGSVPPEKLSLKIRLIGGCILSAGGALIMSFAYNREDYWRLCFPGRSHER